ncbi:MAG: hypothetical protein FWG40_04645 [Peptococcaceae bacterium]|nr:hypothetical protein [Peptococcaceae bacterium]
MRRRSPELLLSPIYTHIIVVEGAMFKRATAGLIVLGFLVCGLWAYFWSKPLNTGRGFFVAYPVIQPMHSVCNLSGFWTSYVGVSEAWQRESKGLENSQDLSSLSSVLEPRKILLPSDEGFVVAAKRFRIQGEWGAKRIALTIEGFWGQAEIYLNGADVAHKVGVIEGRGTQYLLIEPARFLFDQENVLIIHITGSAETDNQVFGGWHRKQGMVTGQLILEALPEGSLSWQNMRVACREDVQEIVVEVDVGFVSRWASGGISVNDDLSDWWLEGELVLGRTIEAKGRVPVSRRNGDGGGNQSGVGDQEGGSGQDGGDRQRVLLTLQAPQIVMWSPEKPVIYELMLFLKDHQGVVDSLQIPLGFAEPGVADDGGWTLNGEPMMVQGVALTRDQAAVLQSANAVERFLLSQKEQGVNVIYFIDYISEHWVCVADQVGIGVWCELPVVQRVSERLPSDRDLESVFLFGHRHPSLLAWTVLKGGETGTDDTNIYLEAAARLAAPCPTYEISYRIPGVDPGQVDTRQVDTGQVDTRQVDTGQVDTRQRDFRTLVVTGGVLKGAWGEIAAATDADIQEAVADADSQEAVSAKDVVGAIAMERGRDSQVLETVAAPICFAFLLFVEVTNLRKREMSYTYLMTVTRLKRWADAVAWLRFMTFAGGMAVASALCIHAFLRIPLRANLWLAYPWDFLGQLQGMPIALLWLSLGLVFILLRLLQLGLASPGFRHSPDPLRMVCWLEQRCNWRFIAALGWVWAGWGGILWVAFVIYCAPVLVSLPTRWKVYRRMQVRKGFMWILPAGMAVGVIVFVVVHMRALVYFWRVFI